MSPKIISSKSFELQDGFLISSAEKSLIKSKISTQENLKDESDSKFTENHIEINKIRVNLKKHIDNELDNLKKKIK